MCCTKWHFLHQVKTVCSPNVVRILFLFFPFLSGWLLAPEAGMIAHSQRWGQPEARPNARPQCMLQSLWMDGVRRCPELRAGVCSVFEGPCAVCFDSVQHSHQFHRLLGLYALHHTGTPCELSATPPYQPGHNMVQRWFRCSVWPVAILLSDSQHSLLLKRPYSWV